MKDRAAPKPKFTRRGVILGAAGLALVLAVVLVGFGVFDGNSTGPMKAKFVRFDRATNGYAARAILRLKNKSGKLVGSFHEDGVGVVSCRFFSRNPTGEVVWKNPPVTDGKEFELRPHLELDATTTLPEDGRTGRVAVVVILQSPKPPVWLSRARALLHLKQPALTEERFVVCDQVIQCPLVLPDGTLEPPRLVSAPEPKR